LFITLVVLELGTSPAAPELEKRERDVAVLFLDISGYTRLSEQVLPEALNTLVEQ
jgi:class 3 adenylate cyclase